MGGREIGLMLGGVLLVYLGIMSFLYLKGERETRRERERRR